MPALERSLKNSWPNIWTLHSETATASTVGSLKTTRQIYAGIFHRDAGPLSSHMGNWSHRRKSRAALDRWYCVVLVVGNSSRNLFLSVPWGILTQERIRTSLDDITGT